MGGTSAGAINAVLLGLNYSVEQMKEVTWNLDFHKFMDDSWGFIRNTARLLEKYGWYKGDFFRGWIGDLIGRKTGNPDSTFNDLNNMKSKKGFRDISMIGTNLSTRFSEIFSFEHTPRMSVADAVRISMSIPLFFAAKRSVREDVYVDGGVLENYPIKLFDRKRYIDDALVDTHSRTPDYYERINSKLRETDRETNPYCYNKETLGFRIDSKDEISVFRDHAEPQSHQVKDFFDYSWAIIQTIMESRSNQHLHSDDWQRTVYIDSLASKPPSSISATQRNRPFLIRERHIPGPISRGMMIPRISPQTGHDETGSRDGRDSSSSVI